MYISSYKGNQKLIPTISSCYLNSAVRLSSSQRTSFMYIILHLEYFVAFKQDTVRRLQKRYQ